jgi:4-carboxymuconolactone decarboxylase
MDDRERHAAGLELRRRMLGGEHVDRAEARAGELGADFQDLITRYAWGEIWQRPGLALRERRMLVVATLVALGHWDELRLHARAALEQGDLSAAELREILLQQAVYCGVPAANRAFQVVQSAIDELAGHSSGS